MNSGLTTLLQLALSLLLTVQNTTSSPALQQQAISTATQAIQLVTEAMRSSGLQSQASSLLTYQNNQYGFTFRYPSTDSLSQSTTTSWLVNVSNPPGDNMIISVILPSSTYGNQGSYWTDMRDIEVWRVDTPTGIASCLTQYSASAVGASAVNYPSAKIIGGSNWIFNSGSVNNMTTETNAFEYQTLHDGSCYSVRYVSTSYPNLISPDTLLEIGQPPPTTFEPLAGTESDEKQNQSIYLQVLNTFTFSN